MISKKEIENLVSNYLPPYVYNSKVFVPNKSTIYYSGPFWDESEINSAIDSILNGKWVSSGEKVYKFELEFSKKFKVKYSTMVNSGSSANLVLIAALKLRFGWNDDDEIIVSPVGFPTTISVIYQNRLKPVFVDIELDTLNFDVSDIESKITPKTKAIFVSPVLGNPPDFDFLISLCEKYNLLLIGDNCDSLGSKWDGKYLNEYYVGFSNSFYPAHHISTGEGGMVCTNDSELKKIIQSIVWWGRDCYCIGSSNLLSCGTCQKRFDTWLSEYDGIIDHKYVFTTMGYNLKPLDLQGAIGLEQLKKIDSIELNRKNSKEKITNLFLKYVSGIKTVKIHDKSDVSWFGTPFICNDKNMKKLLVNFLEENKIQTRNYFAGNILIHPGYKFLDDFNNFPNSNTVLDTVFFVGASPHYTDEIFDYIESVLKKWQEKF
jgi:CDP-6-deoxy-D-xylo-4-hexulose-3-dehydrase